MLFTEWNWDTALKVQKEEAAKKDVSRAAKKAYSKRFVVQYMTA